MVWVLLLCQLLQMGMLGLLLYWKVTPPVQTAPVAVPPPSEPPSTFDTSTLLLCEPERRAIRHEVSLHTQRPPTTYQYGGKTYRYRSKMSAQRYEYVEVR